MAGAVQTQTQTQGKMKKAHGPSKFWMRETTASAGKVPGCHVLSLPWLSGAVKHLGGLELGEQTWDIIRQDQVIAEW